MKQFLLKINHIECRQNQTGKNRQGNAGKKRNIHFIVLQQSQFRQHGDLILRDRLTGLGNKLAPFINHFLHVICRLLLFLLRFLRIIKKICLQLGNADGNAKGFQFIGNLHFLNRLPQIDFKPRQLFLFDAGSQHIPHGIGQLLPQSVQILRIRLDNHQDIIFCQLGGKHLLHFLKKRLIIKLAVIRFLR